MRFTLKRDHWYAMELIGPEFDVEVRHYSPIKVLNVTPLGKGDGRLELEFFHANYPEGVQSKCYTVHTIDRDRHYLLGRVIGTSKRTILLFDLSRVWLESNFNAQFDRDQALEDWVNRAIKQ